MAQSPRKPDPDALVPTAPAESAAQITVVMQAMARGDREAGARLLPLVYDELRALARARMAAERPGNTLQPTALVHEAYLRVVGGYAATGRDPGWESRAHFFGAAARAMRQILVEQARRKAGPKAGGGRARDGLTGVMAEMTPEIEAPAGDTLAVEAALARLEEKDPAQGGGGAAEVLRGAQHEHIAEVLGISVPTVERDWRFARSWMQREIEKMRSA